MFYYETGYYTFEESRRFVFSHEKDFNNEQFEAILHRVMIVLVQKIVSDPNLAKDIFTWEQYANMEELFNLPEFIDEMNREGFKEINPAIGVHIFGWEPVFAKGHHSWLEQLDEPYTSRLKQILLAEAIELKPKFPTSEVWSENNEALPGIEGKTVLSSD